MNPGECHRPAIKPDKGARRADRKTRRVECTVTGTAFVARALLLTRARSKDDAPQWTTPPAGTTMIASKEKHAHKRDS
jgi:hypothetical protein